MLYNSPRNDQPSAKTSQTSLTDLSLAIETAYESIHTFISSHENSLISDFRIFVIIFFFFFFSKRPSASQETVKPQIFIPQLIYDGQRCASTPSDRSCSHPTSRVKISGLCMNQQYCVTVVQRYRRDGVCSLLFHLFFLICHPYKFILVKMADYRALAERYSHYTKKAKLILEQAGY